VFGKKAEIRALTGPYNGVMRHLMRLKHKNKGRDMALYQALIVAALFVFCIWFMFVNDPKD
jgi:hypothetical protein